MNCYECDEPTTAVAICQQCGVAVCREHVRLHAEEISDSVGPGPAQRASARRVTCPVCERAEHSKRPQGVSP
ncbi:DUF2180 family protein [Streptomyces coeruleoprunus]|uniref:DUF2180 family protein n=1 Tax=Streptomyces coeruleoprunus TaxID=285563 RepID=A0ABV9XI96_9ACTN